MIFRNLTLSVLFAVGIFACENEPPENIGEVQCTVTSIENTAYNNALTFARGYAHLNRVEVSGRKNGQQEAAATDFQVPEQFFFIGDDPRQPIRVPIAEATYTDPNVRLSFYRDTYQLILRDTTFNALPDGNGEDPTDDNDGEGDNDGDNDNEDDDEEDDDGDGEDGDNDDADNDDNGEDDDDEEGEDDNDDNDEEEDDDGRTKATGKTVDLQHFLANAKPSIVLLGDYVLKGKTIKVLVSLHLNELLLSPSDNLDSLVVRRSSKMTATATFQPGLVFSSISEAELQKAVLINFRGETVLFIHKSFNTSLHGSIISKISATTRLQFGIDNDI